MNVRIKNGLCIKYLSQSQRTRHINMLNFNEIVCSERSQTTMVAEIFAVALMKVSQVAAIERYRDIIANITTLKLQFFIDTKITINLFAKGTVVVTTLSRAPTVDYKKMGINDNQIIFFSCDVYEKRTPQSQKKVQNKSALVHSSVARLVSLSLFFL